MSASCVIRLAGDRRVAVYDIGDQLTLEAYVLTSPTRGSMTISGNTLTCADASLFSASDPILVAGAGPLGSDLVTTVSSVSGSQLTLAATCGTSVTDVLVGKPTAATVTCTVKLPDATSSSPSVTTVSTGRYRASFTISQEGEHVYRFAAAGGAVGAEEQLFVARERRG